MATEKDDVAGESSFPEILRDGRTQGDGPLVNDEVIRCDRERCEMVSGPECAWCVRCGWIEEPGGGCSV